MENHSDEQPAKTKSKDLNHKACSHNWQRRRDGRWCPLCDVVEYGNFNSV